MVPAWMGRVANFVGKRVSLVMLEAPAYLSLGFTALTLLVAVLFYLTIGRSRVVLLVIFVWLVLQAGLARSGFYRAYSALPPRLFYSVVPLFLAGFLVGFGPRAKQWRVAINLEYLHYLHAVRIFVEVIFLHGLYESGLIAKAITYEGTNFDVYVGLTAPLIGYLVFRRLALPHWVALVWNAVGFAVLTSVFVQATLSAPSPLQQMGFDQPTVAIFYFPFIWLPTFVAPVMIWAHLLALDRLRKPM